MMARIVIVVLILAASSACTRGGIRSAGDAEATHPFSAFSSTSELSPGVHLVELDLLPDGGHPLASEFVSRAPQHPATSTPEHRRVTIFADARWDPPAGDESARGALWLAFAEADGGVRRVYTGVPLESWLRVRPEFYARLEEHRVYVLAEDPTDRRSLLEQRTAGEESVPAPLLLSFDLEVLNRDSDADGLTDVEESRLLTNPRRADTDGDGRNDRSDVNPLVPLVPLSGATLAVLELVVREKLCTPEHLLLLSAPEPFDLAALPCTLLTLGAAERSEYSERFGARGFHRVAIAACHEARCFEPSEGRIRPRFTTERMPAADEQRAAVVVDALDFTAWFEAHQTSEGWRLIPVGTVVGSRNP